MHSTLLLRTICNSEARTRIACAAALALTVSACGGDDDGGSMSHDEAQALAAEIGEEAERRVSSDVGVATSSQAAPLMSRIQMVSPKEGGDLILFSQPVELSDMEALQLNSKLTMWMRENREEFGATAVTGKVSGRGSDKLAERFEEKRAQLEGEGHEIVIVDMPIDELLER